MLAGYSDLILCLARFGGAAITLGAALGFILLAFEWHERRREPRGRRKAFVETLKASIWCVAASAAGMVLFYWSF